VGALTERRAAGAIESASRSVVRSLTVLEVVALHAHQPMRLVDVVSRTGLPKTTCHRILNVLAEGGLLRVDEQGRFGPGALLLAMGMNFLKQTDVRVLARPQMEKLTAHTQETCHLGVIQFPWVVYLEKVESPLAVRMHSEVGALNPLYCTGLGKALLAYSTQGFIDEIANSPLEARTPQTITDPQELQAELARIRERGFAIDDVENEDGIRCVSAPVFSHDGSAIAAISLAGPETRLTLAVANELGPLVAKAALDVSEQLGYSS